MNSSLADVFQKLNLEPGTYHVQVNGYDVEIRVVQRKAGEPLVATKYDEEDVMLEPWVELPDLSGGTIVQSHLGEPEPPDIPDIPPYLDGDECGMLDPWVELPSPKPIGTVIAQFALPSPPDIPEIPGEDDLP